VYLLFLLNIYSIFKSFSYKNSYLGLPNPEEASYPGVAGKPPNPQLLLLLP
jgi:hypothetical protein